MARSLTRAICVAAVRLSARYDEAFGKSAMEMLPRVVAAFLPPSNTGVRAAVRRAFRESPNFPNPALTRSKSGLFQARLYLNQDACLLALQAANARLHALTREGYTPKAPAIAFRVGQVVQHRHYGLRGVIVGYDPSCTASDEWMTASRVNDLPLGTSQPFYYVLADVQDAARLAAIAAITPASAAAVKDATEIDAVAEQRIGSTDGGGAWEGDSSRVQHSGGASSVVDVTIEHEHEVEEVEVDSRSSAIGDESSDDEEGEVAALYASCARNDEEAAMQDAVMISANGAAGSSTSGARDATSRASTPPSPQSGRGARGRGKPGATGGASLGLSACSGTLALRPLYVAQENIRLLSSPHATSKTIDAAAAAACIVRHPLLSSYFVNFRLADGGFTPRPDVVDTAYPDDALCMVASSLAELADWSCSQPRLGKLGRGAASAVVDAALLSSQQALA